MDLRTLSLWLLVLAGVVVAGMVIVRRRRARARAARPIAPGPTAEEEAFLDSSHISGPLPGLGDIATRRPGDKGGDR